MGSARAWHADGKLLLFDRDTGLNRLYVGEETTHFKQVAPRTIQLALTNACDKSCSFCYRPAKARSQWTYDEVLEFFRFCDGWGVVEIALGGGEPTLFPRFSELLRDIWNQTAICPNITTHGLGLTDRLLGELHGHYGQIQLSVYDEDPTYSTIERLVRASARFGLNYLMTPSRVRTLEADVQRFVDAGVADFLFLSYKGHDSGLHLNLHECVMFDESVLRMHRRYGSSVSFKVDVCWGKRLSKIPQLFFDGQDCLANDEFISVGSDKKFLPCSFHGAHGIPFESFDKLRELYTQYRGQHLAANTPGCRRIASHGFDPKLISLPSFQPGF